MSRCHLCAVYVHSDLDLLTQELPLFKWEEGIKHCEKFGRVHWDILSNSPLVNSSRHALKTKEDRTFIRAKKVYNVL